MSNKAKTPAPSPFDLDIGVPSIEGALTPKLKLADRISKRIIGVFFGLIMFLAVVYFVAMGHMGEKPTGEPAKDQAVIPGAKPIQAAQSSIALKEVINIKDPSVSGKSADGLETRSANLVGDNTVTEIKPDLAITSAPAATTGSAIKPAVVQQTSIFPSIDKVPPISSNLPQARKKELPVETKVKPPTPEEIEEGQRKQDRLGRMKQAQGGSMKADGFDEDPKAAVLANSTGTPNSAEVLKLLEKAGANSSNSPSGSFGQGSKQGGGEQDEKLDFVKDSGKEDRSYHPHKQVNALSENEIKTGSFIPLTLEQSINSDIPGQITSRVRESVYDTISGCRMLIPAMTKVIGKYDSKVAFGQSRMLVVWNGMVFPDGSELNLAGMEGYDTAGQAGMESEVDNHYLRLFGAAFGMSMVTAGVQLSVPQNNVVPGTGQTPSQTVATALAQQYGQLGAQLLGKYMAVQPTLRNYSGEKFIIMVPRTIVFNKVWRNRCETSETH